MTSTIARAFTPGGGEAPEAVAQRAAGQAKIDTEAAVKAAQANLKPPEMPKAPTPPPMFTAGAVQKFGATSAAAGTTIGTGATAGQTTRKSLLGQ